MKLRFHCVVAGEIQRWCHLSVFIDLQHNINNMRLHSAMFAIQVPLVMTVLRDPMAQFPAGVWGRRRPVWPGCSWGKGRVRKWDICNLLELCWPEGNWRIWKHECTINFDYLHRNNLSRGTVNFKPIFEVGLKKAFVTVQLCLCH